MFQCSRYTYIYIYNIRYVIYRVVRIVTSEIGLAGGPYTSGCRFFFYIPFHGPDYYIHSINCLATGYISNYQNIKNRVLIGIALLLPNQTLLRILLNNNKCIFAPQNSILKHSYRHVICN